MTKKTAPPVGERTMIAPEDMAILIDETPRPFYDRHLPDGRLLQHVATWRQKPAALMYRTQDGLSVHWGKSPTRDHGYLRCLTASYANRYPTWDELHMLRDVFFPDTVDVMSVLPRASTPYINDHPYALWLWEAPTAWNFPERDPATAVKAMGLTLLNEK